jgi:protein-S-isoprenylcysteine O-methyltransferase Ste14
VIHFAIGIIAVVEYLLNERPIYYLVSLIGLIMFTVGLLGRRWAVKTLGKYHSAHIEIRKDQILITLGPYKYVRHPIYLSIIFELLGFPLIPNAYYAFLLSLLVYIPLLLVRLHIEEKILTEKFTSSYRHYKSTVPRLIPFTKW